MAEHVLLQIREKREAFHGELYAAAKPEVASLYLKKWRENRSWATKTFTNEEECGERRIRTRAGMKDTGPLPERKVSEPALSAAAVGNGNRRAG